MNKRFTKSILLILSIIILLIISYLIYTNDDEDWKIVRTNYNLFVYQSDSNYKYQINFSSIMYLNGDTSTIPRIADGYLNNEEQKEIHILSDSSKVIFENQTIHLIDTGKTIIYIEYPNGTDTIHFEIDKNDSGLFTKEKTYY